MLPLARMKINLPLLLTITLSLVAGGVVLFVLFRWWQRSKSVPIARVNEEARIGFGQVPAAAL